MFGGAGEFAVAFIGGLTIGQTLLVGSLVSTSSAKLGTRYILAIGTAVQAGALVAASFSHQLWQMYLTEGVLFGWGSGMLCLGASPVIPQWFTRRRGFANAIALAGSGAGGLVYSLATEVIFMSLAFRGRFALRLVRRLFATLPALSLSGIETRLSDLYIRPLRPAYSRARVLTEYRLG